MIRIQRTEYLNFLEPDVVEFTRGGEVNVLERAFLAEQTAVTFVVSLMLLLLLSLSVLFNSF